LAAYKSKLVVLPRRNSKNAKAGDATAEEVKFAQQIKGDLFPIVNKPTPVTFETVTDDMKAKNVYAILRQERCNARMAGKRAKKAKEAAEAAANKKDE
jgi:large subunit ribosomal protein L13e